VKLLLGKRACSDLQRQEAWWAENRPAAPDLFAREFKDTLEHIRTIPGAGERAFDGRLRNGRRFDGS